MIKQEWITDRLPTGQDADRYGYVYITNKYRSVCEMKWDDVTDQPWMPTNMPEPYVKPKRYKVEEYYHSRGIWVVRDCESGSARCHPVPTREAAERIAAIYEEVMP